MSVLESKEVELLEEKTQSLVKERENILNEIDSTIEKIKKMENCCLFKENKKKLKTIKTSLFHNKSLFIKFFIGDINIILSTNQKSIYCKKYETFKERFFIFLLFISICAFFTKKLDNVLFFSYILLHVTLYSKENIIKTNGLKVTFFSSLKHTIQISIAVIFLFNNVLYLTRKRTFFIFLFFLNCLINQIQFYIQKKRLYVLRALSKDETYTDITEDSLYSCLKIQTPTIFFFLLTFEFFKISFYFVLLKEQKTSSMFISFLLILFLKTIDFISLIIDKNLNLFYKTFY